MNVTKIFLILPRILSTVSSVFLMSKILQLCGPSIWLQIATIQSIAVIISPLIQMHWTKFGALNILENSEIAQKQIVSNSVISRMVAFGITSTGVFLYLKYFMKLDDFFVIFAGFLFSSSLSLNNEWYYIAKSNLFGFLARESAPRFIFCFIILLFTSSKSSLSTNLLILSAVNVITLFLIIRPIPKNAKIEIFEKHKKGEKFRFTLFQFLVFLVLFSPVPLVNYFDYSDKFQFTTLERFFRLFMAALMPVSQWAHIQILSAENRKETSKQWYKKGTIVSLMISVAYVPCLVTYLVVTDTFNLVSSPVILIGLFGALVVLTFLSRILEEIYVTNFNNMASLNLLQKLNILNLVSSLSITIFFRQSFLILIALIFSEVFRVTILYKKNSKSGIKL